MGRRVKNPPYVHEFTDRLGKPRWYFRRVGFKRVALPGLPWSPEFLAAHEAAMKSAPSQIAAVRTAPGSVNASIVAYYESEAWTEGLAEETKKIRRRILEHFRNKHGDKPIRLLKQEHMRDKVLAPLKTFDARKNWLKAIRGLMAFCVEAKHIKSDPTFGIKLRRPSKKSSGFMTWKEDQIEQYRARHPLGTMARLAIELLLNIAARRQDACRIGRQHERAGKLSWRPHKTLRTTGRMLTIGIMPELRAALEAMPPSSSLTYLTTDYERPFASAAAFGNKFADWCVQAGLKSVVCDDGRERSFRLHGLRKAACRQLAHAGCTAIEIQAVSGHATLSQVQVYINEVEQERMAEAAMKKRYESQTSLANFCEPSKANLS